MPGIRRHPSQFTKTESFSACALQNEAADSLMVCRTMHINECYNLVADEPVRMFGNLNAFIVEHLVMIKIRWRGVGGQQQHLNKLPLACRFTITLWHHVFGCTCQTWEHVWHVHPSSKGQNRYCAQRSNTRNLSSLSPLSLDCSQGPYIYIYIYVKSTRI